MQIANSICFSGQGDVQTSKYSGSSGAAIVSSEVLRRWQTGNNIFFDAAFILAPNDLEVAVLQCTTNQNLSITQIHVTSIHSCNSIIQGVCHTHITPAPVPLICKKLKNRRSNVLELDLWVINSVILKKQQDTQ